ILVITLPPVPKLAASRAVTVIACQRDVECCKTGSDDLPVRLDGNGFRQGVIRRRVRSRESSRLFSTSAKAGVERAITIIAHQHEVAGDVEKGRPCQHNLPVLLEGKGIRLGKRKSLG